MNRLSWDKKPRRRPGGTRPPQPKPEELCLIEAVAELIRVAWATPHRNVY